MDRLLGSGSIRNALLALCFSCLASCQSAAAGELVIRPTESVSAEYLWLALEPQRNHSREGLVVVFWAMPDESLVVEDELKLLGFAIVGVGDIGEIPVSFEVWGSELTASEKLFSDGASGPALAFSRTSCGVKKLCEPVFASISLRLNGEHSDVFVNGSNIGSIRSRLDPPNSNQIGAEKSPE
jgi:hypothetical protein